MGGVRKVITTNIGTAYTLTLNIDMGTAEGLYIMPRTTNGGNIYTGTNLAQVYVTSSGTYTVNFTASTSTTQLLVEKAGIVTQTFYIDNVKVEQSTPTLTSYPIADVVSAQHYFPYHSTMQTWEADGKEYTFGGANGQEKDFEIFKGAYTAEFWEYDSRLGKRWNIDPVVKEHESPFAVFGNSPIRLMDPNGADSVEVNGTWKWKLGTGEDYCTVSGFTGVPSENLRAFTQIPDKILREGFMVELQSPIFKTGDKIRIVDTEKFIGTLTVKGFDVTPKFNAYLWLEYNDLASGYDYFNYAQTVYRTSPRKVTDHFGTPTGEVVNYPSKDPYYGNGLYNKTNYNLDNTTFTDAPSLHEGQSLLMENSIVGRKGPASSSNYQYQPILTLRYFVNPQGKTNGLRIAPPTSLHLNQIRTAKETH